MESSQRQSLSPRRFNHSLSQTTEYLIIVRMKDFRSSIHNDREAIRDLLVFVFSSALCGAEAGSQTPLAGGAGAAAPHKYMLLPRPLLTPHTLSTNHSDYNINEFLDFMKLFAKSTLIWKKYSDTCFSGTGVGPPYIQWRTSLMLMQCSRRFA